MELLLLAGVIFVLYQSGTFASLGVAPGGYSAYGGLSRQISLQESQVQQSTGSNFGYNPAATWGSNISTGIQQGADAGPAGAAAGAVAGAIKSIMAGMQVRAQQASIENQALNYAVQGFDQALQQINIAFNSHAIDPPDAIALVQQVYEQFWQVQAQKIQPNRNGCANGSACPGSAMSYAAYNGVPGPCPGISCYCANTIGATCCVGCGPIRLSIERVVQILQQGGGGSTEIAPVIGDHYGLQTRVSYILSWSR